MEYLASFMRYEIKYMLSTDQKQRLLDIMKDYMRPDEFGHTEIRNIKLRKAPCRRKGLCGTQEKIPLRRIQAQNGDAS